MNIENLTADTILKDDVFCEIFEQENDIVRERLIMDLEDRAKELKVKTKFDRLLSAYKKEKEKYDQQHGEKLPTIQGRSQNNLTEFKGKYNSMECGKWFANENGIFTFGALGNEIIACYHPILPIQRLINIETGKEKIKIAFKKRGRWKELTVEKGIIASSNRIVQLAEHGVSATSENAKALVKYLSDVENLNIDAIDVQASTTKLGWHDKKFVPYDKEIIFDGEAQFKDAYESIEEVGDEEEWLNFVSSLRKTSRFEINMSLVGSLASVLIKPLNALPFMLNMWSETGKGKTVALMLATSCWANPGENVYMTDPKSTATALEIRLDFLNNMPMMLDDMSQVKERYQGDFTSLVYMLCSGKGKDRSNPSLGLNKSTNWQNIILSNYEYPLVTETMQGGAVNRIIDIEMEPGYLFEDGNQVVEFIKNNYGFAGRRFIEAIEQIGMQQIREWQKEYLDQINQVAKMQGVEKEEKQSLPMSILLAADKIATEYIFEDGEYLDINKCVKILKNKGEVSENERAYDFIMSEVAINTTKFNPPENYNGEVWGKEEEEYVYILNNVFNRITERGNFSRTAFLSWADKKKLLETDKGRNTKKKRVENTPAWCVALKKKEDDAEIERDEDGFVEVTDKDMVDLPFM